MTKPTPPVTPGLWIAASLLAITGFLAGSLVMSIFVYRTTGEISYHRVVCVIGNISPPWDPIDKEEKQYLNGKLAFRRITYQDGTIEIPEGDPAILDRVSFWTYVVGVACGIIGGTYGWFAAKRMRKTCHGSNVLISSVRDVQ